MPDDFAGLLAAVKRITSDVAAAQAADVDAKARFPTETIKALKDVRALSAPVPVKFGGMGCTMRQLADVCSTLAQGCGSSAMVLAMHYIQVACMARHGSESEFFRGY